MSSWRKFDYLTCCRSFGKCKSRLSQYGWFGPGEKLLSKALKTMKTIITYGILGMLERLEGVSFWRLVGWNSWRIWADRRLHITFPFTEIETSATVDNGSRKYTGERIACGFSVWLFARRYRLMDLDRWYLGDRLSYHDGLIYCWLPSW